MELTVLIVTYDRPVEIRKTIAALMRYIRFNGQVKYHICDDGTQGNYVADIIADFPTLDFTTTTTNRQGWGANVNQGLKYLLDKTDFIFLCEDDYVAKADLNLNHGTALLLTRSEFGAVRYDGLSGHLGLYCRIDEVQTPYGKVDFLEVDKDLSQHFNVYSNRPHLVHPRWYAQLGFYREGLKLGETEVNFCTRVRKGKPKVAILSNGIDRAFEHIGHSRQHTELDI